MSSVMNISENKLFLTKVKVTETTLWSTKEVFYDKIMTESIKKIIKRKQFWKKKCDTNSKILHFNKANLNQARYFYAILCFSKSL